MTDNLNQTNNLKPAINQSQTKDLPDKKPGLSKQLMVLVMIGGVLILFGLLAGWLWLSQSKPETSQKTSTSGFNLPASPSPREINIPSQPKVEGQASFTISADQTDYNIGETFNLTIVVKANGEKVDGAEFLLTYDPQAVEVGSLQLGSFFSLYPQKKVDQAAGQVRIIALQKQDQTRPLDQAVLITLPVTGLKSGLASFTFVKDKCHIAAYGGQDLLKEAAPLTIEIN